MQQRVIPILAALSVIIAGFAYSKITTLGYVWDDIALFIDSPLLRDTQSLWTSITQPILPGTSYLRPLVLLTFIGEFSAFGVNPVVSHTVNLGFHLINVVLVGILASRIIKHLELKEKNHIIWLSMLLYGVHPTLIEPVTWVAGRFDLMVTTFMLMGLICAHLQSGTARSLLLGLSFFLAALSKEMAVTFPILFALFVWHADYKNLAFISFAKKFLADRKGDLVAIFLFGGLYLTIRYFSLVSILHTDHTISAYGPITHIALIGKTLVFYATTLLWPYNNINPQHPTELEFSLLEQALGICLIITIAFLLFKQLKHQLTLERALLWSILVSLLPVLNILPLTIGGNIGHERFLVLPATFFSILVPLVAIKFITHNNRIKKRLYIVAPPLVAIMAFSVINIRITVPLWANDVTLWSWVYHKHPNSPYVQFSLIAAATRAGDLDYARKIADEILDREGEFNHKVKFAYAMLLARTGNPTEAINIILEELKNTEKPHQILIENNIPIDGAYINKSNFTNTWVLRGAYGALAESYIATYQFDKALESANIGLFYQKNYPPLHLLKALALYGMDKVDEGKIHFEMAISLLVPHSKHEPYLLRAQFLKQICSSEQAPPQLCKEKDALLKEKPKLAENTNTPN